MPVDNIPPVNPLFKEGLKTLMPNLQINIKQEEEKTQEAVEVVISDFAKDLNSSSQVVEAALQPLIISAQQTESGQMNVIAAEQYLAAANSPGPAAASDADDTEALREKRERERYKKALARYAGQNRFEEESSKSAADAKPETPEESSVISGLKKNVRYIIDYFNDKKDENG